MFSDIPPRNRLNNYQKSSVRPDGRAVEMESIAPFAMSRDTAWYSKIQSHLDEEVGSSSYPSSGAASTRPPSSPLGFVGTRAARDVASHAKKRPRLDLQHSPHHNSGYNSPYSSSAALQASSSAASLPSRPAGSTMLPSEDGGLAKHIALRHTESTSPHRLPAPILHTQLPYSPSSDGLPPTWGPLGRGTSFSSSPLASPLPSSSYPGRDSGNSPAVHAATSPGANNYSRTGDGVRSHHTSLHGKSPVSYVGTPMALHHANVSSGSATRFTASPQLPPLQPPPLGTYSGALTSSQSSLVPPSSLPLRYYDASTAHYDDNGPQPQYAHELYAGGRQRTAVIPSISHMDSQEARHSNAILSRRHMAEHATYPAQQAHLDFSGLPGAGGWAALLGEAAVSDADTHLTARPRPAPAPAAPLHTILHPIDDDPSINSVTATSVLGSGSSVALTTLRPVSANAEGKPERRQRSTFTKEQRNETSQTRAVGACLRCKSQRVRCIPSPRGPFYTCLTCEMVSRNSKKVLHDIRCVRWRLVEMTVYRTGGLNLTRRWDGTHMKDVGDWADSDIQDIEMKLFYTSHMHRYDLCDAPVKLRVRRFVPKVNDVLSRKWTKKLFTGDGAQKLENRFIQLPAYALADVHETSETLKEYFNQNTLYAMSNVARHSLPVVREHIVAAIHHYESLPKGDVEKVFLEKFFRMWFYIRFTTGSSYISGANKLGCAPVNDPDYPLGDKISVPRMITAQCDSIMVSRFLRPLSQELIPEFEKFFHTGNPNNWFTLYVCTFMLLHEVSFSCQDRRRHAIENWITDSRYTVSRFVKNLQFGANIILCHWHYYRTMDPLDDGWDIFCQIVEPRPRPKLKIESAKGKGKKKVYITREQCALITTHWRKMVETAELMSTPPYHDCYEHPLFFVSQMYVRGWEIRETYSGPEQGSVLEIME